MAVRGAAGPSTPSGAGQKGSGEQRQDAKVMGGWNMLKPEPKNFWFTLIYLVTVRNGGYANDENFIGDNRDEIDKRWGWLKPQNVGLQYAFVPNLWE